LGLVGKLRSGRPRGDHVVAPNDLKCRKRELKVLRALSAGAEDAPYPVMQVGVPYPALTHHQRRRKTIWIRILRM